MLSSEPALLHQALEGAYERLYAGFGGARFERRGDLIVAVLPGVPIPQCNGAWVSEDSASAADALAEVVAEVEAAGEWPWVQTRLGQERAQHAAVALGLTHEERVPAMLVLPDEVVETDAGIEIELVAESEIAETNAVLAESFGAHPIGEWGALCKKHGFALRGPLEYRNQGRTLRVNHWVRDTSET